MLHPFAWWGSLETPTILWSRDGISRQCLDPSYAPGAEPPHEAHQQAFGQLRRLVQAGLVEPLGVDDLAEAAQRSKSCRLTSQGKLYWTVAKEGRI